jgi:ectoine hydroxylase-related dioxygenase (phytanoyl-CoA dioxygenase family)
MTYRQDGYHVARQVLPQSYLDTLEHAVFEPIALQAEHVLGRRFTTRDSLRARQALMVELKAKAPDRYLNALKVAQLDVAVLSAAAQPALQSLLRSLGLRHPVVALKPYPILIAAELHFEGGYNIRPPHQEWPVMQGSHNGVVVWFPLHDVGDDHSSLELYPGSHLGGVLPYEVSRCGSRVLESALTVQPQRLDLRRGDLVAFSAFTVHRSSPEGDALRAAFSIRFNDLAEPGFIERGYPDTSSFSIAREPLDELEHRFQP